MRSLVAWAAVSLVLLPVNAASAKSDQHHNKRYVRHTSDVVRTRRSLQSEGWYQHEESGLAIGSAQWWERKGGGGPGGGGGM